MKDFKKLLWSVLHMEEYYHKKQKDEVTTYNTVKKFAQPLKIQRLQIQTKSTSS